MAPPHRLRPTKAPLAIFREAKVVGTFDLLFDAADQCYPWFDSSVAVDNRTQERVLAVQLCSNHHFDRVHTRFSFRIVLSGQEKKAGHFRKRQQEW
jgi:hypothetical protein